MYSHFHNVFTFLVKNNVQFVTSSYHWYSNERDLLLFPHEGIFQRMSEDHSQRLVPNSKK